MLIGLVCSYYFVIMNCRLNETGFYVLDHSAKDQLILGPFQGKVACQTIKFGRGVCGAAALKKETVLVDDVDEFAGHIACEFLFFFVY